MQKRRERIEKWRQEKNKGKTETPVVSLTIFIQDFKPQHSVRLALYRIII